MSAVVMSVANQKGGVGKTTTAINLASYLSEEGFKVLVMDMDPQANATSGLGIDVSEVKENVYHLLIDQNNLEKVLYPTVFDNLHIIPSNKNLAGAEVELIKIVSRETVLRNAIQEAKKYYDYIFIDCPPSLGLLTVNALVASDRTIIPLQCEYYALEGIANLINTLTLVKEHYNPSLEIAGIVLTMYDKRTALNQQVVENAKTCFKDLVFDTIIPRNIRLTEAPSHGLPIALYNSKSKGATAYYNLAKEVKNRVKQ
ncbi:ParA family protein [Candidatus Margulisiibacteriota bacterium]